MLHCSFLSLPYLLYVVPQKHSEEDWTPAMENPNRPHLKTQPSTVSGLTSISVGRSRAAESWKHPMNRGELKSAVKEPRKVTAGKHLIFFCSLVLEVDDNEELQLVHHPESVFVRFQINPKEVPRKISFVTKKQVIDLRLVPSLVSKTTRISLGRMFFIGQGDK